MLRDAVGYTCEVKTAQKTGESGGIRSNHWEIGVNSGEIGEFRGIRGGGGEFRENWWISGEIGRKFWWNWGKIGGLCFPNGEKEFRLWNQFPPHQRNKSTLDNSPPPNYDKESKDECHHVNTNARYKWYVKPAAFQVIAPTRSNYGRKINVKNRNK